VKLVASLFPGRDDVYPVRWESKAAKSGHSPACANEWRSGICEKPWGIGWSLRHRASSIRGCVIGRFVLGILESMVNLWSAQWCEVGVFALVILVPAFRPTGLFGSAMVEKV
jgi:hypothetical protein